MRDLRYFDEGFVSKKCDDELIEPDFAIGMSKQKERFFFSLAVPIAEPFWLQLEKLWDPQSAHARRELRTCNFEFRKQSTREKRYEKKKKSKLF